MNIYEILFCVNGVPGFTQLMAGVNVKDARAKFKIWIEIARPSKISIKKVNRLLTVK